MRDRSLRRSREAREQLGSASLTLTAFFVRASVVALTAQPILNASLDEAADEIVYHDAINVGVAVASDDGLVVPVVHDTQTLSLRALGDEINRLTAAARSGGLPPEEIRGATFTVTNYGTEGGRFATPIVRPPQVAILGCGAIRPQPVVDGDRVVAAPALPLSLSADHRVVDGHDATAFLDAVADAASRTAAADRRLTSELRRRLGARFHAHQLGDQPAPNGSVCTGFEHVREPNAVLHLGSGPVRSQPEP